LLFCLEQLNHPSHVGKIALQRARVLAIKDRPCQCSPVCLMLSDDLEASFQACAAVGNLTDSSGHFIDCPFEHGSQHFLL
jgi:hypothetical protein